MTTDEKLGLVAQGSPVPRLGIPAIVFTDGPNGVGEGAKDVTQFPSAVNIGASWDPELANRYGKALGAEAGATKKNLLGAPTINLVRTPKWGRAAETFSEDPYLTAKLAAPEVIGIQSTGVMSQVKHYAGNNQELGRLGNPLAASANDDKISSRTLQEVYLPGFKSAVGPGGAASVMCSYNQINGTPVCQNKAMLDLLKDDLELDGYVGPDATLAIRDLIAAANAGVDNFQLGSLVSATSGIGGSGGKAERDALAAAVANGTVSQGRLDDAARRILIGMIKVGLLDDPKYQTAASTPANRALATTISAQSSVLLRNEPTPGPNAGVMPAPVLPLGAEDRSIAVIGYDGGEGTMTAEPGSPAVAPGLPIITPLQGIRDRAPKGTVVDYAAGTKGVVALPVIPSSVLTPAAGDGTGLSGTYYSAADSSFSGTPVLTRTDPTVDFVGQGKPLEPIPGTKASSARWTGFLTAPATGEYRFSLSVAGHARLLIDGKEIVAGDAEFIDGSAAGFAGAPPISFHGTATLTAGQRVPVTVDYSTNASIGGAEFHLGWQPPDPALRDQAVAAARNSDVAVVFVNDVAGEGMDRPTLSLPGDQDQLIEAVAAANPRTVVVLHTSSAVLMPWRDKVAAIVEAWYPGQQTGAAIAKTLYGDIDPAGRLPVTFPAAEDQGPTADPTRYPGVDNVAEYSEDLLVGYRYYDANDQKPLYPFGYGLSYTSFSIKDLNVTEHGGRGRTATVQVTNTGKRSGSAVVQLYLTFPTSAGEPPRQLKAFRKIALKPGQSRRVALQLDPSTFQVFDEGQEEWAKVSGTYRIAVGTSSHDLPLTTTTNLE